MSGDTTQRDRLPPYAKALLAFGIAILGGLSAAAATGDGLTLAEGLGAAATALSTAAGVYRIRNGRGRHGS